MICPFLGMSGDSRTALAFPSAWNHCHHCKPDESVALDHQKTCCLSGKYEACHAFLQSPNNPLPIDLRNIKNSPPVNRYVFWKAVLLILVLLIVMFILGGNLPIHDAPISTFLFPVISSSAIPSSTLLPVTVSPSPEPANLVTFTPPTQAISNSTSYSGSRVTP